MQQTNKKLTKFELALLRSIDQTSRREGRISTPEQILARRVERPKGSVKPMQKLQLSPFTTD